MHKSDARYTLAKDSDPGKVMHATPLRLSFSFLEVKLDRYAEGCPRGCEMSLGSIFLDFSFASRKTGPIPRNAKVRGTLSKARPFFCVYLHITQIPKFTSNRVAGPNKIPNSS
jgi:hypothetical protein